MKQLLIFVFTSVFLLTFVNVGYSTLTRKQMEMLEPDKLKAGNQNIAGEECLKFDEYLMCFLWSDYRLTGTNCLYLLDHFIFFINNKPILNDQQNLTCPGVSPT